MGFTFAALLVASLVNAQCSPSPCGVNTNCQVSPSGAAICRCQDGYSHLPGQSTIDGCPTRRQNERPNTAPNRFRPQRPVNPPRRQNTIISAGDPCQPHPCGINAECESSGGRAICKCPRGFTGDPFTRCDDNPCNSDPCGSNADCENAGNRAVCRCRDGYEGDPFVNCELNPCFNDPCGANAD